VTERQHGEKRRSRRDRVGEDVADEDRSSPFPYADRFEDWVDDETATDADASERSERSPDSPPPHV
jgi:hypothetical protein